mgnify:FL=1
MDSKRPPGYAKDSGFKTENYSRYHFRDPVVKRVCDKFVSRSNVGFEKYGRTLHDERTQKLKDISGYLNDVQEELMDAILYIQSAKEEAFDLIQQIEKQDEVKD